jgi:hypothetical protein
MVGARHFRQRNHLQLVEPAPSDLPNMLAHPPRRKEVEQLTEALVEALIEMMDLVDGDPDTGPNGDESEDGDGV